MAIKTPKTSYTIPCSSAFRDAINALAASRQVNVADLARSILLVIPETAIREVPDPGGPPPEDREETTLKSGPSAGKLWRRKPRLQVRLSAGYNVTMVRRALNLALKLNQGDLTPKLEKARPDTGALETQKPTKPPQPSPALQEEVDRIHEDRSSKMIHLRKKQEEVLRTKEQKRLLLEKRIESRKKTKK